MREKVSKAGGERVASESPVPLPGNQLMIQRDFEMDVGAQDRRLPCSKYNTKYNVMVSDI